MKNKLRAKIESQQVCISTDTDLSGYGYKKHGKTAAGKTRWITKEGATVLGQMRTNKDGKYYNKHLIYCKTGLQGSKEKIRSNHQRQWCKYKNIIAPLSQIHHEWIAGTADYRGVALVEADQHMYGVIDVIEVLDGRITCLTEEEVRGDMTTW